MPQAGQEVKYKTLGSSWKEVWPLKAGFHERLSRSRSPKQSYKSAYNSVSENQRSES